MPEDEDRTSEGAPIRYDMATGYPLDMPRIGGYLLKEPLGEGAMGRVFRAIHEASGEVRALKLSRHEFTAARRPLHNARFLKEIEISKIFTRSQKEGVVQIHGFQDKEEPFYLVMDYVEGTSLENRITSNDLSRRARLDICTKIAKVLINFHVLKFLHRDIKPSNFMINKMDNPIMIDFGISKDLQIDSVQLTAEDSVPGTIPYIAPELLTDVFGDYTDSPVPDVFSFGILCYEVLSGAYPFAAKAKKRKDQKHQYLYGSVKRLVSLDSTSWLPMSAAMAVDEALSIDPEKRVSLEKMVELFEEASEEFATGETTVLRSALPRPVTNPPPEIMEPQITPVRASSRGAARSGSGNGGGAVSLTWKDRPLSSRILTVLATVSLIALLMILLLL